MLRQYRQNMSPEEREALILQYAHLVRYVVGRIMVELPRHVDRDDLIGHGTIGLIRAVDKFDPRRGVKFETYAISVIRGAVLEALRQEDWVPRSVRDKSRRVAQAIRQIELELGRPPEDAEIAEALEMTLDEYQALLASIAKISVVSLETGFEADPDSSGSPVDEIADQAPGPDAVYGRAERKQILAQAIDSLPEREKLVIALYYQEGLTLKEIGLVLEVTESRVCQLHTQALLRLRGRLEQLRPSLMG
ncbi:MAG TPA: FliA/WhiG family RNA polymerase sigma factor [Armatimonadota bacterium]|nr:FliA/WhiG family RNA polymerase sigma factor [Armatimonadota bacterium]